MCICSEWTMKRLLIVIMFQFATFMMFDLWKARKTGWGTFEISINLRLPKNIFIIYK